MPGQLAGREVRGEVTGLARQDHRAVPLLHHQGLVPIGVPRRGDDVDAGPHLGLAAQLLVHDAREVDQGVHRVPARAGLGQLRLLHQDGPSGEQRIAAAVVEVQMTVDHYGHVVEPVPRGGQCGCQGPAPGAVVRLGLRIGLPYPRVEQQ